MSLAPPPGETVHEHINAEGSRARIAALLFLALRPAGASTVGIAEHLALPLGDARGMLNALRTDHRIASERDEHGTVTWFIPRVRAQPAKPAQRRPDAPGALS